MQRQAGARPGVAVGDEADATRVRGVVTIDPQLKVVPDIAERWDRGYGHFSTRQNLQLNWPALETVPDILAELGKRKGPRILVGFAAETDDVLANARAKLQRKNLDLVVANDVGRVGAGFDVDTNAVTILDATGGAEELPLLSKREVADRILDRVTALLRRAA